MNTLDILQPIQGSNQHITKFDAKPKTKFRLKVKFTTKVQIAVVTILLASLAGNYLLLKQFTVFKCSEGGYFMTKENCNDLYENKFAAQEASRIEFLQANPDLQ